MTEDVCSVQFLLFAIKNEELGASYQLQTIVN